ncbi:MAG TPA: hypothetical protein DIC51_02390 [Coxiellaceae bacterium]|nr:hypothetical protein [Coxiellaceae bacterium]
MDRIEIIKADITTLTLDAMVNAAKTDLISGGSVYASVHRAAGPELLLACRQLNGCETGQAKITPGYHSQAKYIIHTVCPAWHGGDYRETELLASCYQESLKLAVQYDCETIAFPALGCGLLAFPIPKAIEVALYEITQCLKKNVTFQNIYLVCLTNDVYEIYQDLYEQFRSTFYAPLTEWTREKAKPSSKKQPRQNLFQTEQNIKKEKRKAAPVYSLFKNSVDRKKS